MSLSHKGRNRPDINQAIRTIRGVWQVLLSKDASGCGEKDKELNVPVTLAGAPGPTLPPPVRGILRFTVFQAYWARLNGVLFPPPYLKLYERPGRGESGQVLNGTVFVLQSRAKHSVVARLFLRAHMDFRSGVYPGTTWIQ